MPLSDLYFPGVKAWLVDAENGWQSATITTRHLDTASNQLTLTLTPAQEHAHSDNNTQKNTVIRVNLTDSVEAEKQLPPLRNPPVMDGIDDLTHLSYLHEPAGREKYFNHPLICCSVLNTIKVRYADKIIYTYSGIVLIAINPFARVPLYTLDVAQAYIGKRRGELEPHLFAVAEDAFRCMTRENKNQSIIVSGESGAGKTVSAKYIMRYFAAVANYDTVQVSSPGMSHLNENESSGWEKGISEVEEQVLATNPIMEAFGNAKTTRNDNSSRFGKYIEIQFNDKADIVGAKIRTYLLERSRVVFQPEIERNYHIFYQLCAGAPHAEKKELSLSSQESFYYLKQGGQGTIAGVDDAADFETTARSLSTIGISVNSQWKIFRILAAILHIGNVEITMINDQSHISDTDTSLLTTARLLGVDAVEFKKWLVKKQIIMRTEKIVSNLTPQQSMFSRDAVAKYLYHSLFDWLVKMVNDSIANEDVGAIKNFIGVLDIYGFEHFKRNSFEQFCINYANEKLQQEFNQHVFKLEQEEYIREEINWSFIDFNDNKPCIELIEGKLGILDLLDEETRLPSGTDTSFTVKIYKQFASPPTPHKYFEKPRFSQTAFTVVHYAHSVVYEVDGFLEKNKDTMPDEILCLLQESELKFCKSLFQKPTGSETTPSTGSQSFGAQTAKYGSAGSTSSKRGGLFKVTLGSSFKLSLASLMETMRSTNVHYIRCIKPNEQKLAFVFDSMYVVHQLRACGVLETIRISCAGYPSRFGFSEFTDRYKLLLHSSKRTGETRALSLAILQNVVKDDDKFQIGLSKVFLRAGQVAYVEKSRQDKLTSTVILIQKNIKCLKARRSFTQQRSAAVLIQRVVTNMRRTRASIIVQKYWRRHYSQSRFRVQMRSIVKIQSLIRRYIARKHYLDLLYGRAARRIRNCYRVYVARKAFRNKIRRIVVVQSAVRRRLARKELKKLKVEARSFGHFQAKAGTLEKKVFELTQLLAGRENQSKSLGEKVIALESQIKSWKEKVEKSESKRAEVESLLNNSAKELDLRRLAATKSRDEALASVKSVTDDMSSKDKEISRFKEEVSNLRKELDEARDAFGKQSLKDDADKIAQLMAENASLKDKIAKTLGGKSRQQLMTSPSNVSVPEDLTLSRKLSESFRKGSQESLRSSGRASPSGSRRQSLFAYPNTSGSSHMVTPPLSDEVKNMISDTALDHEIVDVLIVHLAIPPTLPADIRPRHDVMFPASLIGMTVVQCWRYGFTDRVKSILSSAIKAIHETMKYDEMTFSAFWVSNLQELIRILKTAEDDRESDMSKRRNSVGSETGSAVSKYRSDLEFLAIEVYYNWLKELKKHITRMAVPSVVEHQGLPGFLDDASNNIGFFNKLMGGSSSLTLPIPIEKLLGFLTKLNETMTSFYMDDSIRRQVLTALVKLLGTHSFNQLLMRKNFCTWRRGMQIQYNVTRIEEWCIQSEIGEAALHLEPLMQAAKLLQLNKTSVEDVEIMFDVCFLLSPGQIRKILSMYHAAEFENPVAPDILKAVANRCLDEKDNAMFLESAEDLPYVFPTLLAVQKVERHIPVYLEKKLPLIKQLLFL